MYFFIAKSAHSPKALWDFWCSPKGCQLLPPWWTVHTLRIDFRSNSTVCKERSTKEGTKTCSCPTLVPLCLYALMSAFSRHKRENQWSATIMDNGSKRIEQELMIHYTYMRRWELCTDNQTGWTSANTHSGGEKVHEYDWWCSSWLWFENCVKDI